MKIKTQQGLIWNTIEKELMETSKLPNLQFHFFEMGQNFSHGFSVYQTHKFPNKLHLKIWSTPQYFDVNTYFVPNIKFKEEILDLTEQDIYHIKLMLNTPFDNVHWEGITLDGLSCKLQLGIKIWFWNGNYEINDNLELFIVFIREKAYPYLSH